MADKYLTNLSIPAGKTSVSTFVYVAQATQGTGIIALGAANFTARYCRQGGTVQTISLDNLAAVDSAYSSGGIKELDATNMPGVYRFDIPDAALASGADSVVITLIATSSTTVVLHIALPTLATLATAVTDDVVEAEDSITLQQAMSIILAAVAGRTTNGGLTFKTPDNAATRITASVDASKNRTSITLNPSA